MEMILSPAQEELVAAASGLREKLAAGYRERETARRIEPELRREIGALGLIGPELPSEYGGRDLPRLTSGLIVEQIARGDFNVGYLQVVGSLVGQILASNATAETARKYVPRITSGEGIVGIGLSEPDAGSDAGNPRMTARKDGDSWVIDGVKSMSFATQAEATVIFARTDPEAGRGRGISAFVLDVDSPGVRIEPVEDTGTRAVERGLIHCDGVRVPASNLLGTEGAGFTQVMQGFDFSRALIGLQCLGTAEVTVEETWDYVSHREAFDQPLSKFQGVSFPLAEAETQLAAARLLCLRTLHLKDTGQNHTKEAAMCKWWAPKVAHDAITQCLLLHGQFGYRTDKPIEQRMRDVLGLQIGDGTAQIMKLIIARQSAGRQFAP